MPKRKRASPSPPSSSSSIDVNDANNPNADPHSRLSTTSHRLVHKLTHPYLPRLSQAFKLAKGFERQKLGRRFKTARADGNGEDEARIESEIAALKGLDAAALSRGLLGKRVWGIKSVRERAESGKDDMGAVLRVCFGKTDGDAGGGDGKAELNVRARLVNSGPVKGVIGECVEGCLEVLGMKGENAGGSEGKRKRLRKKDFEDKGKGDDGEEKEPVVLSVRDQGRNESEEGGSEDELAQYNDRLASSSEGENDEENDNVDDLERQLELEGIARKTKGDSSNRPKYDPDEDLSFSEEEELALSASPSPEPQKSASRPPLAPINKSAFLPSLSLGGYISGSDSDIDDEIDFAAPKKNRPGQRARQQIWEKKYGSKAKHLQKQERQAGWDPKRGATEVMTNRRDRRAGKVAGHRDGRKDATRAKTNGSSAADMKHRDDSGPIHPSWEAAKRAKERREAPVAFQGKKVVFD